MNNPLRLCFIGPHTHVHMARWVRYYIERGHDVSIISTSAESKTEFEGRPVYPFPLARGGGFLGNLISGFLSTPLHVRRLKTLLKDTGADVAHVHYVNEAAFFSVLAGFRPLVVTAWGSDILVSPEKSKVRKAAVKHVARRADLFTCDADHMKSAIVNLGAAPDRVAVVFFGTDVEKCDPARRSDELRAKMAPPGADIVISIRNLEPVYDLETLVRAARKVCDQRPKTYFWIGGSGSEKEKLVRLMMELNLSENVRFLGPLPAQELPAYLASADVYVSTALSDGGLAASTAEAMACGTPVVITDVMNNGQWVKDGRDGLLVPPRSPDAVAGAILRLLADPVERKAFGAAARGVIVERNNFQKEMERMEGIYRRLVSRNGGAA